MKVGQITYCGNNYGSVLQCLATQMEFRKRGLDCVLLKRYETGLGRIQQSLEYRINRIWKTLRYPQYRPMFQECLRTLNGTSTLHEEAINAISSFIQTHIQCDTLSWRQMRRMSRSKECLFCISGSDQIWSARWFFTNRLYFLRFCPAHKRVAWMPSFGEESVAPYNRPTYARYLAQYAKLSVREASGGKIIENLAHTTAPVLGDPVFLLNAEEWRSIAVGQPRQKPYILLFFLEKPSTLAMKQMELLRDATGCELVCFSYDYAVCDASLVTGGPEQFLDIIDHAEAVLTDSFHACTFAAILDTPFYAFARSGSMGSKQMCRITELVQNLSVEDRYIVKEADCVSTITPLPTASVQRELEGKRHRMQTYMTDLLEEYRGKDQ